MSSLVSGSILCSSGGRDVKRAWASQASECQKYRSAPRRGRRLGLAWDVQSPVVLGGKSTLEEFSDANEQSPGTNAREAAAHLEGHALAPFGSDYLVRLASHTTSIMSPYTTTATMKGAALRARMGPLVAATRQVFAGIGISHLQNLPIFLRGTHICRRQDTGKKGTTRWRFNRCRRR